MLVASTAPTAAAAPAASLGSVAPPLDLTDPDSLFAFFQVQMSRTQGRLASEMQAQEDRAARIDKMHGVMATFADYKGDSVREGSPGWDQVKASLEEAKTLFGPDSAEAKGIDALLAGASTYLAPQYFPTREQATPVAMLYNAQLNKLDDGTYMVRPRNEAVKPIEASDLKNLSEQLKQKCESLTSDSGLAMIRVQQYVEQSSQIVSHCSNVMKKMHEMDMVAIENIR
jgi:hypothetical protein